MPPLIHEEDDASDVDVLANDVKPHIESNIEADVHAKDQLKDELMDDLEAKEGKRAAKEEKKRVSPTDSNEEEEDVNSDEEDDEAYEVESIVDHEWRKKKMGKGQSFVLLYNVKWKGYDESENTLEPEENLVSSRDLLARYHHRIGGAPQPPPGTDSKKKRTTKSRNNEKATSATDDSPAPAAKRQKRTKTEDEQTSDPDADGDADGAEVKFGSWVPKGTSWESEVQAIETVERDQTTKDLYILLLFKNGKKSRVKNAVMRKKAPQRLLDFYEAHLNFAVRSV